MKKIKLLDTFASKIVHKCQYKLHKKYNLRITLKPEIYLHCSEVKNPIVKKKQFLDTRITASTVDCTSNERGNCYSCYLLNINEALDLLLSSDNCGKLIVMKLHDG